MLLPLPGPGTRRPAVRSKCMQMQSPHQTTQHWHINVMHASALACARTLTDWVTLAVLLATALPPLPAVARAVWRTFKTWICSKRQHVGQRPELHKHGQDAQAGAAVVRKAV